MTIGFDVDKDATKLWIFTRIGFKGKDENDVSRGTRMCLAHSPTPRNINNHEWSDEVEESKGYQRPKEHRKMG